VGGTCSNYAMARSTVALLAAVAAPVAVAWAPISRRRADFSAALRRTAVVAAAEDVHWALLFDCDGVIVEVRDLPSTL